MDKHVVFMVHGVGEQVPGETVDEFVGSACGELGLCGPVAGNTVLLSNPQKTEDHQLDLFPCHQRRLPAAAADEEFLIAEVHWADISPAPSGVVGTALDLLRLVLGMGYIALDNVQNNVVSGNACVQRLVPLFVWVFYAIVAPLNVFLLLGASALFAADFLVDFEKTSWAALIGLALIGAAFFFVALPQARRARTYLDRRIMRSLAVAGALTMAFALAFAANIPFGYLSIISPSCAGIDAGDAVQELQCFTGLGIALLKGSWVFQVGLLMVLALASLPGIRRHLWDKRSIYLAVCSAMLIFWMTFTVSIWALFASAIERFSKGNGSSLATRIINDGFADATQTLVYAVMCLLSVSVLAGFVAWRRNAVKDQLSEYETQSSELDLKYGRLILNPWLNLGLSIAIAVLAFSTAVAFAEFLLTAFKVSADGTGFWSSLYASARRLDAEVKQYQTAAFFVVTAIGFVIVNYSGAIAAAIGIARDVTTYLTRSHVGNPLRSTTGSSYVYADEIQQRFHAVVSRVLAQEGPETIKRITFMTHSQGTVVAATGLQALAHTLPVKPTLVTMGSPLTHIYGHYFSQNYQFTDQSNAALKQWINIYRRDDFVGTRVHGNGTQAQNFKVRAKGHGHYWSDKTVWSLFREHGVFTPANAPET